MFIQACADSIEQVSKIPPKPDTSPPKTSITPMEPYHNNSIDVEITCSDASGSGCASIYYSSDGNDPIADQNYLYKNSFIVQTSGLNSNNNQDTVIKYFAVDNVGNIESPINVKIYSTDKASPEVTANPFGGIYNKGLSVEINCVDLGIGCDKILYAVDDLVVLAEFVPIAIGTPIAISTNTNLRYVGVDKLGTASIIKSEIYEFDTVKPQDITNFTFEAGATFVKMFWLNPPDIDFKGIMIRRSETAFLDINSGILVYEGTDNGYVDSNLQQETTYYYRVYSYDLANNFSNGIDLTISTLLDISPPIVLLNTPQGSSTGQSVEPNTEISVQFSEPILSSSVTGSGIGMSPFSLMNNGLELGGTVGIKPNTLDTVLFVPVEPLPLYSQFTATMGLGVTDLAKNALSIEHQWNFSTRIGGWGIPVEIDNGMGAIPNGNFNNPLAISLNNKGQTVVTWTQYNSTDSTYNLWGNYYDPKSGWGESEPLAVGVAQVEQFVYGDLQVVIGENGTALVVWRYSLGSNTSLLSKNYTLSNGWSTNVEVIANDADVGFEPSIGEPKLAKQQNGDSAFVVWTQLDSSGIRYDLLASRYTTQSGWGTPELVESDAVYNAVGPDIAIDNSGNAFVVWFMKDPKIVDYPGELWENRYSVANGAWDTNKAAQFQGLTVFNSHTTPKIKMNLNGDIVMALCEYPGKGSSQYVIHASYYSEINSWTESSWISDVGCIGDLAIDENGIASVMWVETNNIKLTQYVGGIWDINNASIIVSDSVNSIAAGGLSVSSQGYLTAIYTKIENNFSSVWSNSSQTGKKWGLPFVLESVDTDTGSFVIRNP